MIKRIAGWSVLVLLLGGLCVFVFSTKSPPLQSFRKSDGNVVTLIAVTYGTNHSVSWGKPYQRWFSKILPAKLKSLSGIRAYSKTVSSTNLPVFWLCESRGSSDALPQGLGANHGYQSLRVLDEYGGECAEGGVSMSASSEPDGGIISSYQLIPNDPHGKIIGVAVYESVAKTNRMATFIIPGAALSPLPKAGMSSPIVKDGDMTFQLTSLLTGLKSEPFAYTSMSNGVTFSQAAFHITKNGMAAPNWLPANVKIFNAKGKKISFRANSHGFKDDDNIFNFEAELKPADGPFKVQAEFEHQTGFSPDELVTFKNVPFPGYSGTVSPQIEMEIQGQRVVVEAVYAAFAQRATNIFQTAQPVVQARLVAATNSFHLQLVGAVDETGSELPRWGMAGLGKGQYHFSFAPSTRAKTMTLTFAVHQSRFAEFEAMPVVVATSGEKKQIEEWGRQQF